MRLKVYLHTPQDVLAPCMPREVRAALPDIEVPERTSIQDLLNILGVGRARPLVLVNRIPRKGDVYLHDGDQVDLVLPLGGG